MRVLTTVAATCLLAGAIVTAQAPAPNPTNKTGVIGLMHAIHSTNDVDKTLAFYQAVFGLNGQVRPFQSTGPQILTNSPGATLRVAMTQLKGAFNFELTQFGNVERQTEQAAGHRGSRRADDEDHRPRHRRGRRGREEGQRADRHEGRRAGHGADVDRQREGDHHARSGRLLRRGDSGDAGRRLRRKARSSARSWGSPSATWTRR